MTATACEPPSAEEAPLGGGGMGAPAEQRVPGAGSGTPSASTASASPPPPSGGGGAGGSSALPPAAARTKAGGGGRQRKASAASGPAVCQADGCGIDLAAHTFYHQRNKICTVHIKADVFLRDGQELRFCQRCGHAHPLAEFDPGKHSCRKQLEKHNARRRKRQQEQAGGSTATAASAPATDTQQQQQRRQGGARQQAKRSRTRAEDSPSAGEGAEMAPFPGGTLRQQRSRAAAAGAGSSAALFEQAAEEQPAAACCLPQVVAAPAAAQPPPGSPAHASSSARDSSGSAAATAMAGPLPLCSGAAGPHRPPSPPLALLDFDLDLRATPFGELSQQCQPGGQCQVACDAALADELAAWLNTNLAEDDDADALMEQQAVQQYGVQQQQQQYGMQQQQYGTQQQPMAWRAASVSSTAWQQQRPASLSLAQGVMQLEELPLDPLAPFQQPQQQPQCAVMMHQQPVYVAAPMASAMSAPVLGLPAATQQAAAGPPIVQLPAAAAAAPVAAGGACPAPTLATVSVKLFGCTPAELPAGLREHLRGWFEGSVHSMEGYLRPGCVHLMVQALLTSYAAARQQQLEAAPAAAVAAKPAAEAAAIEQQQEQQRHCCCQPASDYVKGGAVAPAADAPVAAAAEVAAQPAAAAAPAAVTGLEAPLPCCGHKRAAEAAAVPAGVPASAVRRVVERMLSSGEALWRTKTMLVQAGAHVALVHGGRLRQTWDLEAAATASSRAVPAILEVSPPLLLASSPALLHISGINLLQTDCQLLLRLQGRYVQPAAALCGDCSCQAPVRPSAEASPIYQAAAAAAAASFEQRCCGCCVAKLQLAGLLPRTPAAGAAVGAGAPPPPACCGGGSGRRRVAAGAARLQSVRVQLPVQQPGAQGAALLPGLLHLNIQRSAYTAPRGARVLVVSSPSVHAELLGLSERGALPPDLLDQLGLVHEWLGQPGKMQYSLVEATAGRLLFWAVGAGLPATAGLLLSVLQAPCGTSSAAAAGVLQRALQPSAAGAAAAGALAGMDGLSQLHLSMQATSAAAMQRAAELACHDGLSLLHRAVQSGCADTLKAVLGWGEEAGSPWRCDLAGPLGVTPLHLAALLPDVAASRQAVALLVARCDPGAQAWGTSCTTDGLTPADFFKAASAARGGAAVALRGAPLATAVGAARPPLPPSAPAPQPQPLSLAGKKPQQQSEEVKGAPAEQPPAPQQHPDAAEMQPTTPRKHGCLCAPGCPCALLDRCACCAGSDEEEEQEQLQGEDGAHSNNINCGAGSGKCCCCSDAPRVAGCAGCEGGTAPSSGPGPAAAGGGSCCGGK